MADDLPDLDQLVEGLRKGERAAFEALVEAAQHRIFGVAFRMLRNRAEAEDVAQEVFLRVHRSIAEFRGEAKLSTWLYGISARLCLNRLARADRRTRAATDELVDVPDAGVDPMESLESAELTRALEVAIGELPEERRIIVVLRDVQGLAYEEIAAALGIELGTVRSRLHRARMELKDKLERFLT
jgi:RNA polymerase sigma-70 factor, ECF subfamily